MNTNNENKPKPHPHELAFDARKALEAGTLEIEGYERSQWVKFDPQNPNTFPEKGEFILVCFYIADPSDGFIGVRGEAIIFDEKFIETINWQLNGFSSVELKDVLAWKKIDLSYTYELVSARLDELEKETRLDWNIEYDACAKYIAETLAPKRGIDEFIASLPIRLFFSYSSLKEFFGVSQKKIKEWALRASTDKECPLNIRMLGKFGMDINAKRPFYPLPPPPGKEGK